MNNYKVELDNPGSRGRLTIGVHFDQECLRLVAVKHHRIRGWKNLPYPPGMQPRTPGFADFLKGALGDFDPAIRQARIWMLGCLPSIQIKFFSVPRSRSSRLSRLVYWSYRKEIPFDAEATVFDYGAEGTRLDGTLRTVDVTAYTVLKEDVNAFRELFARAGYRLDGMVIPHFAMRNLFLARWLDSTRTVLSLYVGEEASAVQIIASGRVVLNRVFIAGMRAILDALREVHPEWSPSEALARLHTAEGEELSALKKTVGQALERLTQQVERSISAYQMGRDPEEIKGIYIMGTLASLPGLLTDMKAQLGAPVWPAEVLASSRLAPGVPSPEAPGDAALLALAVGVALSDTRQTPNLLRTYVCRDRERSFRRSRLFGGAAVVACLMLLLIGYGVMAKWRQIKEREIHLLNERLAQYQPDLNRDAIDRMLNELLERNRQWRSMSEICFPIAVLTRIAEVTPADIRLTAVSITPVDEIVEHGAENARNVKVRLSGMVRGLQETQESRLASYVMLVEDTDLFSEVTVSRESLLKDQGEAVLHFEMQFECGECAPPGTGVARTVM